MAYVTTFTAAIGASPSIQALVVGMAILCVTSLQAFRRKVGPESGAPEGFLGTIGSEIVAQNSTRESNSIHWPGWGR